MIGSGFLKLDVLPDLEMHYESPHRPMLPCCDVALVLQQRDKSVRSRIYSAMLCEKRVLFVSREI